MEIRVAGSRAPGAPLWCDRAGWCLFRPAGGGIKRKQAEPASRRGYPSRPLLPKAADVLFKLDTGALGVIVVLPCQRPGFRVVSAAHILARPKVPKPPLCTARPAAANRTCDLRMCPEIYVCFEAAYDTDLHGVVCQGTLPLGVEPSWSPDGTAVWGPLSAVPYAHSGRRTCPLTR